MTDVVGPPFAYPIDLRAPLTDVLATLQQAQRHRIKPHVPPGYGARAHAENVAALLTDARACGQKLAQKKA